MTKGDKRASKIRRSESTKQILRRQEKKLKEGEGEGSHQRKDIFQTILRGIEKKVT